MGLALKGYLFIAQSINVYNLHIALPLWRGETFKLKFYEKY